MRTMLRRRCSRNSFTTVVRSTLLYTTCSQVNCYGSSTFARVQLSKMLADSFQMICNPTAESSVTGIGIQQRASMGHLTQLASDCRKVLRQSLSSRVWSELHLVREDSLAAGLGSSLHEVWEAGKARAAINGSTLVTRPHASQVRRHLQTEAILLSAVDWQFLL